ncbi:MAG: hypothetical protein ACLFPV_07070 [Spirochaetaceae bacterium]
MSDSEALRLLQGQLEDDYQFIVQSASRHTDMRSRATQSPDVEMATIALAFLIHNLYTAFEGYFLRVAKHFENNLDNASWHRELVDRMRIEVPGIRPALISPEFAEDLDELRRFRHRFRNTYKSRLRADRVREVSESAVSVAERFDEFHTRFIDWIRRLQEAEEK